MRIQNNVSAINAHRYYGINQSNTTKSIAKLSSGYRINSAADDAAGLAISEKMRAQIRGLTMASKNAQDGISLIQTAEGGLQEIDNMLQRIRELVVYASNDTQDNNAGGLGSSYGDRQKIQDEINQLTAEIDSMSERVEFNKKKLLNGSISGSFAEAASDSKVLVAKANLMTAVTALITDITTTTGTIGTMINTISDKASAYLTLVSNVDGSTALLNGIASRVSSALVGIAYKMYGVEAGSLKTASNEEVKEAATQIEALVEEIKNLAGPGGLLVTIEGEIGKKFGTNDISAADLYSSINALGSAMGAYKANGGPTQQISDIYNMASSYDKAYDDVVVSMLGKNAAGSTGALYFQVGANSNQGML
ncbi:MAG: hypothetical protein LBD92_04550, partial [Oscillospiraceae bacterium]|nr:hypothetical protein [Oscillospiraceae bacterium]